jgi:hypothetical protein
LKAAEDVVAAAQDALAKPETLTFYATGPRVSERLRELHRNVDQGFAAPTAPQREHFEELKADVGAALEQASKAEGALAKLNEALAKAGLAAVVWPRL